MNNKIKNNKGQALVEMAFVMPILILILMGIVEFGRILNGYLIVTNATREGARYASLNNNDIVIEDVVRNLTSVLDQDEVTITITPSEAYRTSGTTTAVKIDYKIDIIAPLISNMIPDPYTVTAQTSMRVE